MGINRFYQIILIPLLVLFAFVSLPQKTFAVTCGGTTFGECTPPSECKVTGTKEETGEEKETYYGCIFPLGECSAATEGECGTGGCLESERCENKNGDYICASVTGRPHMCSNSCIDSDCDADCRAREGATSGVCATGGINRCTCEYPPKDEDEGGVGVEGDPDKLSEFINIISGILMPAAVILGLILIVKSGYVLMTSQGDPRKTLEGKEDLTAAIMGLIFVLLSVAILRAIINTLFTG